MELATTRPRFRTDLVAECIEADGQRFIDVIDPDTGDAFRFYEVEYSLACAMDGERDVGSLVQWAREELGIEPTRQELEQVITTLGSLGYLDRETTSRAADEIELRHGVVAAAPDRYTGPKADVELGLAGAEPPKMPPAPVPRTDDLELGFAGGEKSTRRMDELAADEVELGLPGMAGATSAPEPMPSLRPVTRADADDDGPTHLPQPASTDFDDEVSVDLSEHLSLKPSDVKEAVRASRSMKAVDVPPELLEEMERKEKDAAEQAARLQTKPVVPVDPEPVRTPEVIEPKAAPAEAAKPAVELPDKPVVVTKKPEPEKAADKAADKKPEKAPEKAADKAPPAHAKPLPEERPGSGISGLLIALLVLAVLGGGAFFVWKYVLDTRGDGAGDTVETPVPPVTKAGDPSGPSGTTAGTAAVPEPPPAGPPTATLEARGAEPTKVTAKKGGVVFFAVDEGAVVAEGDPLVQFQGVAKLQARLGDSKRGLIYDIETRYPSEIEAATKKRDQAVAQGNKAAAKAAETRIAERTKRLEEQQAVVDGLRAKVAELTVEAPVAGTVVAPVKKGKKVAAGAVVATIDTGRSLVATFDVPERPPGVDASVRLAAKDEPEQQANCQVSDVAGAKVTVTCSADVAIPAGTVVVLEN